MKTKTYNVYQYKELSEEAKQKAIEKYWDINIDYDSWADFELEYWKDNLEKIGFEKPEIRFSGFSSQGDGASFVADINSEKLLNHLIYCQSNYNDVKKIMLALRFFDRNMLNIGLRRNDFRHVHENSVKTEVDLDFSACAMKYDKKWKLFEDFIYDLVEDLRHDLCQTIYYALRNDYKYLTSEEAIIETFEANEYYFNERGEIDN